MQCYKATGGRGGGTFPKCETGLVHSVSKAHKLGAHFQNAGMD
jgi:hypothetical protein